MTARFCLWCLCTFSSYNVLCNFFLHEAFNCYSQFFFPKKCFTSNCWFPRREREKYFSSVFTKPSRLIKKIKWKRADNPFSKRPINLSNKFNWIVQIHKPLRAAQGKKASSRAPFLLAASSLPSISHSKSSWLQTNSHPSGTPKIQPQGRVWGAQVWQDLSSWGHLTSHHHFLYELLTQPAPIFFIQSYIKLEHLFLSTIILTRETPPQWMYPAEKCREKRMEEDGLFHMNTKRPVATAKLLWKLWQSSWSRDC